MPPRHPPLPTRWLMTDERMGDALWPALRRLPRGAGVIFRHHATPVAARRRLFAQVRAIARHRGLVLIRAGAVRMAGEEGSHGRPGHGIVTWPAHDRCEAARARRAGAQAILVSPIFSTRSHPGASSLGPRRAAAIARGLPLAAIALGGMAERRFRGLRRLGFHGYAGIDCWTPGARDQKRKAVPR